MSGACSTYGGEERHIQGFIGFWWGNLRERETTGEAQTWMEG